MEERYRNKIILAPMVRAGTLPMRLLALRHGAQLVYGEEVIDYRIEDARRTENHALGTIDFVSGDANDVIFRTAPELEKHAVVFQVGTNNAERALKVGRLVQNDVSGFDINMGCPKPFSLSGGMGAALLSQPERIQEILTTCVQGLDIPVTCKIRVLNERSSTLELCKLIERCGVAALAVHGRRKEERPRHANRTDEIRDVARMLNIPVIANGGSSDIFTYSDIQRFLRDTECTSVMLARAALRDIRVFDEHADTTSSSLADRSTIIRDYLTLCQKFDADFVDTKYVLQRMLADAQHSTVEGKRTLAAATLNEICDAWGCNNEQQNNVRERVQLHKTDTNGVNVMHLEIPIKRLKTQHPRSPKVVLHDWTKKNSGKAPVFTTTGKSGDRAFYSVVEVDGKKYTCSKKHTNKKLAEQAAALVALHHLNIRHLLTGQWEEL